MNSYYLQRFVISLGITLVVELAMAFFCGIRKCRGFLLIILVNILTNPAAVALAWGIHIYFPTLSRWIVEILIESIVIFFEGLIYFSFSKESVWQIKRPWRLAVISNAASWIMGLGLQFIFN